MKSELRLVQHKELPDHAVIEVWHDGEFIAAVYGADGPGVRVVSKHHLLAQPMESVKNLSRNVIEVSVKPKEPQ